MYDENVVITNKGTAAADGVTFRVRLTPTTGGNDHEGQSTGGTGSTGGSGATSAGTSTGGSSTGSVEGNLASTGSDGTPLIAGAAAAAAALGGGLILAVRRRPVTAAKSS
ncbi:LPXTG cell wall anchor domain-containing protein [Streptomyces sp. bgisy034]|uniref:LPXTG cell wall anchor domain-containing protein n=1 Tax=Streptomyces sp. bgisy034 TaxID=3413774 RepID=UPI003EBB0FB9